MRVLAIDTSSEIGAVALVEDGALRASVQVRVQHQHGETLLPHVDRVLSLGGASIAGLDLLAVGLGPGSFTGVRIGVATVKGLALAHGTPMLGVRTSRVLARAASGEVRFVAIDAKKGEVFVAAYRADHDGTLEPLLEDLHGGPEEVAARLRAIARPPGPASIVGTAVSAHRATFEHHLAGVLLLPEVLAAPNAALLALEAVEAHRARGADDPSALVPIYVRGADAKLPV
ncbi:MAG: tRNA (adenosine(37)-N6)-threonylcarbamoyltransferase complex dimerization subunit type 1 TsaB [Sandaracinaceae bacterium]|nr:tRNA (adenosine(37)-N6)-threonylcarbamoyltransferase complex dimerization subunit type 1 TsaB [Sandaracinaceae bacterium]